MKGVTTDVEMSMSPRESTEHNAYAATTTTTTNTTAHILQRSTGRFSCSQRWLFTDTITVSFTPCFV